MTKQKSFPLSEKIARLEEIERFFQKPDFDIEEGIVLQKEAMGIAKEVQEYLAGVEQSLEQLDIAVLRRGDA
jgi:exonuclease VII small subunit